MYLEVVEEVEVEELLDVEIQGGMIIPFGIGVRLFHLLQR
jgi:hypothetical protein